MKVRQRQNSIETKRLEIATKMTVIFFAGRVLEIWINNQKVCILHLLGVHMLPRCNDLCPNVLRKQFQRLKKLSFVRRYRLRSKTLTLPMPHSTYCTRKPKKHDTMLVHTEQPVNKIKWIENKPSLTLYHWHRARPTQLKRKGRERRRRRSVCWHAKRLARRSKRLMWTNKVMKKRTGKRKETIGCTNITQRTQWNWYLNRTIPTSRRTKIINISWAHSFRCRCICQWQRHCVRVSIYRTATLSGVDFTCPRKKTENFIVSTEISAVRWNDFFVSLFFSLGPFSRIDSRKIR